MEIQIKKTIRAGNSSAVTLPKSWLNKEVRVELIKKSSEIILWEVLERLNKSIRLDDIIGIYLTGSYARGEESNESDVDILVLTKETDKEMISEGIYNILIVSKALLDYKLKFDLFPMGQMIRESKPLLNSDYIESFEIKVTQKNVNWYIRTSEDKIKLIDLVLKKGLKKISLNVVYTLVLRIRTLYIIEKIIKNEKYLKKDFVKLINRVSGNKVAYAGYLKVKKGINGDNVDVIIIKRLQDYLKKQLKDVKKIVL